MRPIRKTAPLILLALALAATPAHLMAQPPGPRHGWGEGFGHGPMAGRIFRMLDLDPGQRDSIHAILEGKSEAMDAHFDRVHTARAALGEQIHAEAFDEGAIRAAAKGLAEAEADLAVARAEIFQQVREILNPEQLDKLSRLRELRQEFRELHGRGRGRGFGRGDISRGSFGGPPE